MSSESIVMSFVETEEALRKAVAARADAQSRYDTMKAYYKANSDTCSFERVVKAQAVYVAAVAAFDEAYTAYTDAHLALRNGVETVEGALDAAREALSEERRVEALNYLDALCSTEPADLGGL